MVYGYAYAYSYDYGSMMVMLWYVMNMNELTVMFKVNLHYLIPRFSCVADCLAVEVHGYIMLV
jgi:hypothetical protein